MEDSRKVRRLSSKATDECALCRCSAVNAYLMDGFVCSIVEGVRASHSGGDRWNKYRYKLEVMCESIKGLDGGYLKVSMF